MLDPFTLIRQSAPLPFSEWLEQRGHIGHSKPPSILIPKSTYFNKRGSPSASISEKTHATALIMFQGAELKSSIPQRDDSFPLYLRYTYSPPCITESAGSPNPSRKFGTSIPLYLQYGQVGKFFHAPLLSSADPRLEPRHKFLPTKTYPNGAN